MRSSKRENNWFPLHRRIKKHHGATAKHSQFGFRWAVSQCSSPQKRCHSQHNLLPASLTDCRSSLARLWLASKHWPSLYWYIHSPHCPWTRSTSKSHQSTWTWGKRTMSHLPFHADFSLPSCQANSPGTSCLGGSPSSLGSSPFCVCASVSLGAISSPGATADVCTVVSLKVSLAVLRLGAGPERLLHDAFFASGAFFMSWSTWAKGSDPFSSATMGSSALSSSLLAPAMERMGAKHMHEQLRPPKKMAKIWAVHLKHCNDDYKSFVQRDGHVDRFFRSRFISWSKQPQCLSSLQKSKKHPFNICFFLWGPFLQRHQSWHEHITQKKKSPISCSDAFFGWCLKPKLIHCHHPQPRRNHGEIRVNLCLLRELWPLVVGPLDELTQQILHESTRIFGFPALTVMWPKKK